MMKDYGAYSWSTERETGNKGNRRIDIRGGLCSSILQEARKVAGDAGFAIVHPVHLLIAFLLSKSRAGEMLERACGRAADVMIRDAKEYMQRNKTLDEQPVAELVFSDGVQRILFELFPQACDNSLMYLHDEGKILSALIVQEFAMMREVCGKFSPFQMLDILQDRKVLLNHFSHKYPLIVDSNVTAIEDEKSQIVRCVIDVKLNEGIDKMRYFKDYPQLKKRVRIEYHRYAETRKDESGAIMSGGRLHGLKKPHATEFCVPEGVHTFEVASPTDWPHGGAIYIEFSLIDEDNVCVNQEFWRVNVLESAKYGQASRVTKREAVASAN